MRVFMTPQHYLSRSVGLCVCVCVCVSTGYEVDNERYQRLQNYANLKIIRHGLRSRDMP